MPQPRNPVDDAARVVEGDRSSEPEVHDDATLADIGELVRQIAGTEIGCVSLLDPERGWITRSVGSPALPPDAPLALSFAAQTVLSAEPLLIPMLLWIPASGAIPWCKDRPIFVAMPASRYSAIRVRRSARWPASVPIPTS